MLGRWMRKARVRHLCCVAGQASSWLAVDEVEVISSSGSDEEETGAKENRASKLLDRYAQIRHRMCLSGWSPS